MNTLLYMLVLVFELAVVLASTRQNEGGQRLCKSVGVGGIAAGGGNLVRDGFLDAVLAAAAISFGTGISTPYSPFVPRTS